MTGFAYIAAALAEIAGCFAFWAWLRMGKSIWWIAPGIASLVAFAWLLTLVEADHAGRTYAAYGGVYIASAIVWLWMVEGAKRIIVRVRTDERVSEVLQFPTQVVLQSFWDFAVRMIVLESRQSIRALLLHCDCFHKSHLLLETCYITDISRNMILERRC